MKMSGMKLGMMACCTIMVIPLVGYFVAGGSFALSGGALSAALPLVACVGLHGAMYLFMGKSCHGDKKVNKESPTTIPVVVSKSAQKAKPHCELEPN
jgi:hypothetical protein